VCCQVCVNEAAAHLCRYHPGVCCQMCVNEAAAHL